MALREAGKTSTIEMTRQEMMALMKAIGVSTNHPDMDEFDRQIVSWLADRIERELNTSLAMAHFFPAQDV